MDEISEVVPFYSGASYSNLDREYGRRWPCTKDRPLGTPFLFEEPSSRRFHFAPVARQLRQSTGGTDYPLTLVFGNSLYYWHHDVLIQHSETLEREYGMLLLDYPEGFAEVSPEDAQEVHIRDGDTIRICSALGSAVTRARDTRSAAGGGLCPLFCPRGW